MIEICYFEPMKKGVLILFLVLVPFIVHAQIPDYLKEQACLYREEGYKLQSFGDIEGAMAYYQKAIKVDTSCYKAYNDLGVVLEVMGDEEAAIKMYEQAVSVNPAYMSPYTNLALLYEKRGNNEKAIQYWVKRIIYATTKDAWWYKAREHLNKFDLSPELKKQIFQHDICSLSRNLTYQMEQERLKALEEAKMHFNIGMNLFSQGDYSGAEREFKTALSLNPSDKALQAEISSYYITAKKRKIRSEIQFEINKAMGYLENDGYQLAAEKLKDALSIIFSIQE